MSNSGIASMTMCISIVATLGIYAYILRKDFFKLRFCLSL